MARRVKMTVNNYTGQKLTRLNPKTAHGKFTQEPPLNIEASGSWICTTRTWGTYGPKGTVTYETPDPKVKIEFFYDHPMGHSTSSYRVTVTPSNLIGYEIKGSFTGEEQDITFELYPIN